MGILDVVSSFQEIGYMTGFIKTCIIYMLRSGSTLPCQHGPEEYFFVLDGQDSLPTLKRLA